MVLLGPPPVTGFSFYTLTGWVMVAVMTSSLEVPNEPSCSGSTCTAGPRGGASLCGPGWVTVCEVGPHQNAGSRGIGSFHVRSPG